MYFNMTSPLNVRYKHFRNLSVVEIIFHIASKIYIKPERPYSCRLLPTQYQLTLGKYVFVE